jgi:3-hydroxyisobutyrate dehydrogenase-like beta-hydroxyacid dehydrogenase
MSTSVVGFIGLGSMGLPMVRRLLGASVEVIAFDTNEAALAAAKLAGARTAGTPKEVADVAEIVLVSLPTPGVVAAVATGPTGIAGGSAVRTYIDLSTTGPAQSENVAAVLTQVGIDVLDAPVSGGAAGAAAGTLTIMASGAADVFDRVKPVLDVLGRTIRLVGSKPGQGQLLKLINNMLSATALAATSEALVLGAKAGLDPGIVLDVVNASSGRNTATSDKFPRYVLPRTFDFGFSLSLMAKDIALFTEEARRQRVPSWVAGSVDALWAHAVAQGWGDKDSTAIVQLVESWAGAEVRERSEGSTPTAATGSGNVER